ncbi:MAG: SHOCT domain-containing protein [Geminicoccaceae bacterium]
MTKVLAKGLIMVGMAAAAGIGLGGRPGLAHNDWGLPLVGGLVGGYALSSMMHRGEGGGRERVYEQPVYAAPAPVYAVPAAPAAPTAASIEQQLNVLDQLAAKGYITQSEYQARRQALLNQL